MIRITRETDYGILLLAELSSEGERAYPAREIAERVGLSQPMASKILKGLVRAGLLESNRGAKGGYSLSRPLNEISIGDVIRGLEGPVGLVECVTRPGQCEHETSCPSRVNWQRISGAILQALDSVAVAELVDTTPPPLIEIGERTVRGISKACG